MSLRWLLRLRLRTARLVFSRSIVETMLDGNFDGDPTSPKIDKKAKMKLRHKQSQMYKVTFDELSKQNSPDFINSHIYQH